MGAKFKEDGSPTRATMLKRLGVAAGVLAAVVGCQIVAGQRDSVENRSANEAARAVKLCRDAVRAQLKDPKSAEFEEQVSSAANVAGRVTATNSFGGRVTQTYTCTIANGVATATLR